jgi:hypothetical protein
MSLGPFSRFCVQPTFFAFFGASCKYCILFYLLDCFQLFKKLKPFPEAAMNVRIGAQYQQEHLDYVRAVDEFAELCVKHETNPFMWSSLFFHLSGYAKQTKDCLETLTRLSLRVRI